MSSDVVRITYHPRLDATPESELVALAAVYSRLIESYQRRKVANADESSKGSPKGVSTPSWWTSST